MILATVVYIIVCVCVFKLVLNPVYFLFLNFKTPIIIILMVMVIMMTTIMIKIKFGDCPFQFEKKFMHVK